MGGYYEDFQRVAGVAVALEHELLQAGLRVYGLPALEGDWVERQAELAPAAYYLAQTKAPLLTLAKICMLKGVLANLLLTRCSRKSAILLFCKESRHFAILSAPLPMLNQVIKIYTRQEQANADSTLTQS